MAKEEGELTGRSGARGTTGKTGKTGAQGARGPMGPPAAKLQRADVLAMVEDQFGEVRRQLETQRRQLDVQLVRFSQIQQQLDEIHGAIKRLIEHDAKSN